MRIVLDLDKGRSQQKHRTRNALVAAARDLVTRGEAPTVEDAAQAAGISRTTAYRYFKNQAELLAATYPETAAESLLPERGPSDPARRLDAVIDRLTSLILESESVYRTSLRLSLDPSMPPENLVLRQGRAIGWIEDALSPLRTRLTHVQRRRLAIAIRSATGIEALVWLVDVAGLSRDEAKRMMRFTARTLLRGALTDG